MVWDEEPQNQPLKQNPVPQPPVKVVEKPPPQVFKPQVPTSVRAPASGLFDDEPE